jgi:ectoine hydroxylase-related dioxygenase (phytanoyl-CoA dioxygenase family)
MAIEYQVEGALTQEARDRFERDGFLVVDDPCPPELAQAVRSDAESLFQDAFDTEPDVDRDGVVYTRHQGGTERFHWHRVREAWKIRSSIREMALAPRVLSLAGELFGRRAVPFQTLNFPMGTQQPPHIDAFYFNSDPNGLMCGFWIALEDMDMENGPLVYYPGSHKLPLPEWGTISQVTGIDVSPSGYATGPELSDARSRAFTAYCQDLIERHNLEPQYGTIRAGQGLLWAANLLHGGAPQRDLDRTRHSQVTHYYFEGCRHYRPFLTQDDHRFWSYPEWIREPPPDTSASALRAVVEEHVPAGATMLVVDAEELHDLEDRRSIPFPRTENGSQGPLASNEDIVRDLEELRAEGAEYIVFPKRHLMWFEYHAPELQNQLENNHHAVLRDGAYGVIYALDEARASA